MENTEFQLLLQHGREHLDVSAMLSDSCIVFEGNDIFVYANKEMLGQVWVNLLDNAIKFSPENNIINVCIDKEPEKENKEDVVEEVETIQAEPKIVEDDTMKKINAAKRKVVKKTSKK